MKSEQDFRNKQKWPRNHVIMMWIVMRKCSTYDIKSCSNKDLKMVEQYEKEVDIFNILHRNSYQEMFYT